MREPYIRRCGSLVYDDTGTFYTTTRAPSIRRREYLVHDDAKEKDFELELSWVGSETNGIHQPVPKDLYDEASRKAKEALETFE